MNGSTNLVDEKINTAKRETVTFPSAWGSYKIEFAKRCGAVTVSKKSGSVKNGVVGSWTEMGNVPSWAIPSSDISVIKYDYNALKGSAFQAVPAIQIRIGANGKVQAFGYVTAGTTLNIDDFILSYIVDD